MPGHGALWVLLFVGPVALRAQRLETQPCPGLGPLWTTSKPTAQPSVGFDSSAVPAAHGSNNGELELPSASAIVDTPFVEHTFEGAGYVSVSRRVPFTVSYQASVQDPPYGFSVFLTNETEHAKLAAGAAFTSVSRIDGVQASDCPYTTHSKTHGTCLSTAITRLDVGVGSVFDPGQLLFLSFVNYTPRTYRFRYHVSWNASDHWIVLPASRHPITLQPEVRAPFSLKYTLRVNTGNRRVTMYLTPKQEVDKFALDQPFHYLAPASRLNVSGTFEMRGVDVRDNTDVWVLAIRNELGVSHGLVVIQADLSVSKFSAASRLRRPHFLGILSVAVAFVYGLL